MPKWLFVIVGLVIAAAFIPEVRDRVINSLKTRPALIGPVLTLLANCSELGCPNLVQELRDLGLATGCFPPRATERKSRPGGKLFDYCATTAKPPAGFAGAGRLVLHCAPVDSVCSASLDGACLDRLFCAPNRASATQGPGFRFRRARSSASRRRRSRAASGSTP